TSADETGICDRAAIFAADQTGVPVAILQAITLAETGRGEAAGSKPAAWPWTVQAQGQGHWFPDSAMALAFAEDLLRHGIRNFDLGCFQVNFHWHSAGFTSVSAMLTPELNAVYAAEFLQTLMRETGDWRQAVGHYHSRDAARAEVYVQRLETMFAERAVRRTASPAVEIAPERAARRFSLVAAQGPLLQRTKPRQPLIGAVR
ncbi:transglycosylase SLT domain-containing protein, partial [Pseudorhodobacter sp.]|uniref:transglycosylase SLT domain-containing protein n=1 Tax=Pseudorhodobacter sp. TaxID=1934400 RepID=UPI002649EC21